MIDALRTIPIATRETLRQMKFSEKLKQIHFYENYSIVRVTVKCLFWGSLLKYVQ